MNRDAIESIAFAVATIALAVAILIFGLNLLPSAESVAGRLGNAMPLYLTWGIIAITEAAAVTLAAFLLISAKRGL